MCLQKGNDTGMGSLPVEGQMREGEYFMQN